MRWLCGWRVVSTLHHSSPTLHPDFFWGCEIFSWIRLRSSAFNDDQLRSSMVTSFGLQWWPASVFDCGWLRDEVKSGEEWWRGEPTLHLSEPQCLSGFQTIWWRVKSKSESSLFISTSLSFFFLLLLPPDVSFLAWQWHYIALARGNIVPLPGNIRYEPLYIRQGHHGDFRVTSWHLVSIIITLLYINRTIVVKPHTPWKG